MPGGAWTLALVLALGGWIALRLTRSLPSPPARARTVVDGSIVGISALLVAWQAGFGGAWRAHPGEVSSFEITVATVIVAVGSMALVMCSRATERPRPVLLARGSGICLLGVAHGTMLWAGIDGQLGAVAVAALVIALLGAGLFAGTGFRPLPDEMYGLPTRASVLVPSLPFAGALVAIASEVGEADGFDPFVAWAGSAVALLVVARQVLALLENIAFWHHLEGEVAARNDELRHREARFRSLVHNSSDVITVVGADGAIQYQSASVERVLGPTVADVERDGLAALVHPADLARVAAAVSDVGTRPGVVRRLDCRVAAPAGAQRFAELVIANRLDDPDVGAIVLNMRDVTERRELEEQLSHMAFHDSLTTLVNRGVFTDRLGQAMVRSQRSGSAIAVVFLDLDDFKSVNDSLGHIVGDGLLVAVAVRLRAAVREGDTVARLGGDEFAVLLEDVGLIDELPAATDALLAAFDAPFEVGDERLAVRASAGVAVTEGGRVGADDLLRHADIAMYGAKANGKGGVRRYEESIDNDVVDRMHLEVDLRLALTRGELYLEYQPLVDLVSTETLGFEALVRWQHPTRGVVAPLEFIPIAERSGMISELGAWVLRTACLQAGEWQRGVRGGRPLKMSVNLSVRQLAKSDLVEQVEAALEESQLAPGCLMLEVTESVVMDELATATLERLHRLGVLIALDDFGTGYSSLAYLRRLPVDTLKIDRTFMPGAGDGAREAILAEVVVSLARTLGLDTVAEGVETQDQRQLLLSMGARVGQGYLFGRPVGAAACERRLRLERAVAGIPPTLADDSRGLIRHS